MTYSYSNPHNYQGYRGTEDAQRPWKHPEKKMTERPHLESELEFATTCGCPGCENIISIVKYTLDLEALVDKIHINSGPVPTKEQADWIMGIIHKITHKVAGS
jgi:hypothetical protein